MTRTSLTFTTNPAIGHPISGSKYRVVGQPNNPSNLAELRQAAEVRKAAFEVESTLSTLDSYIRKLAPYDQSPKDLNVAPGWVAVSGVPAPASDSNLMDGVMEYDQRNGNVAYLEVDCKMPTHKENMTLTTRADGTQHLETRNNNASWGSRPCSLIIDPRAGTITALLE